MAVALGLVAGATLLGYTSTMLSIRLLPKFWHVPIRRITQVFRVVDLAVLSVTSLGLGLSLLLFLPQWLVDRMLGPYGTTVTVRSALVFILGCIYLGTRELTEAVEGRPKALPLSADASPIKPPLWDPDLDQ